MIAFEKSVLDLSLFKSQALTERNGWAWSIRRPLPSGY